MATPSFSVGSENLNSGPRVCPVFRHHGRLTVGSVHHRFITVHVLLPTQIMIEVIETQ